MVTFEEVTLKLKPKSNRHAKIEKGVPGRLSGDICTALSKIRQSVSL